MELNIYLANRLKEIFTEGKWVLGTNFKEQIINLNWKDATHKLAHFNTIADLTFHIWYYTNGIANVLEGGTLDIKDKFSFDAPPINSEQDWHNLVHQFCVDCDRIIKLVENASEEKLLSTFANKNYGSYYRNIDAMIEHTYYHLGQIILIKKKIKHHD